MKLARNAVFMLTIKGVKVARFIHVNKNGFINPFWMIDDKSFSVHGELIGHPEGLHEHWRSVEHKACNVLMIQSHVTKASDVDFKRCRKFSRKHK